jgi:biopolymer transport protein ExbD
MARSRNRWQSEDNFDVPQTPLIDIIFILIVFFLVATTFYTEERDVKVKLPEGTEGDLIARESEKFVINVRDSGIYVVNNQIVSLDDLDTSLADLGADGPAVEIRGDADTRHAAIMAVMNLCKKNGVLNYSLTQRIVREQE